jgi:hypothetical protein
MFHLPCPPAKRKQTCREKSEVYFIIFMIGMILS